MGAVRQPGLRASGRRLIPLIPVFVVAALLGPISAVTAVESVVSGEAPPPAVRPTISESAVQPRSVPEKPAVTVLGPGDNPSIVHVKFREGTDIRLRGTALRSATGLDLSGVETVVDTLPGASWSRLFDLPEGTLAANKTRIEAKSGRQQADFNLYYRLALPPGNAATVIDDLNALEIVELAYPQPLGVPPPVPGDYKDFQGYLDPATEGVDAEFAWPFAGGTGAQVRIIDIEYDWRLTHDDLTSALLIENGTKCNPWFDDDHGTGVLGEMIALNDGVGVTGAVYDAEIRVVNQAKELGLECAWDLPNAIAIAHSNLAPGDVLLIEAQTGGPSEDPCSDANLIPVEWNLALYDAIVAATSDGIIVVEPAGNGGCDLDDAEYGDTFPNDRADSGAIIVGAGGVGLNARSRLGFSSYGSRVNVQGWGEEVVTAGTGDLYDDPDDDKDYTNSFSGTSSASPIVASAAAIISSFVQQQGGLLTPTEIRSLLADTGSPQGSVSVGNIGPLPDVRAALAGLAPELSDDLYFFIDEGATLETLASVVTEAEPNNGTGTAQPLDDHFSLGFNGDIGNMTSNISTTRPHVSVRGTGDGTVDVYRFEVPVSPVNAVFEIDNGWGGGSPASFDPMLRLLDSGGAELDSQDDAPFAWGAGGSIAGGLLDSSQGRDPYLGWFFLSAGTYYVEVGAYPAHGPVPAGAKYDLQVSTDGHPVSEWPGVFENDKDFGLPGEQRMVNLVSGPSHGTLDLRSDGSFTYVHSGDNPVYYSDTFRYSVSDGTSHVFSAEVEIVVAPENDPPVASDDLYDTDAETALTVAAPGVLGNDTDEEADPLLAQLDGPPPAHGTVTLDPDGGFVYTPHAGYSGSDTFWYRAFDGTVTGNLGTAVIEVGPPPAGTLVIVKDGVPDGPQDFAFTGDVGAFSLDDDADPTLANTATFADLAPGTYSVTEEVVAGWPLIDVMCVDPDDGSIADLTIATAIIDLDDGETVTCYFTNRVLPTANPDTYTTPHQTLLEATSVLDNDTDPAGGFMFAVKNSDPAVGQLDFFTSGTFRYTPPAGFSGDVTFEYHIEVDGVLSAPALVTITVEEEIVPATGTITGTVMLDDSPLAEVEVWLLDSGVSRYACTDNDGAFIFGAVTAGAPLIAATGPSVGAGCANADFVDPATGFPLRTQYYDHRHVPGLSDAFTVAVGATMTIRFDAYYKGDNLGMMDPASGQWHLRRPGGVLEAFYFGNPGDVPFVGDWDCDGVATPGLFRLSDAFAYLRNSNDQGVADIKFFFGDPNDVPLAGDFNGDGCDTLSLYRPSEQRFYIINELGENNGGLGAADYTFDFGNLGDTPFVGDFDGDGIDEVGLHRERTGLVYFEDELIPNGGGGAADHEFIFGDPKDRFVAGDWTAAGFDAPGLFRPSDEVWYLKFKNEQGIADASIQLGEAPWLPVAGFWGFGRAVPS